MERGERDAIGHEPGLSARKSEPDGQCRSTDPKGLQFVDRAWEPDPHARFQNIVAGNAEHLTQQNKPTGQEMYLGVKRRLDHRKNLFHVINAKTAADRTLAQGLIEKNDAPRSIPINFIDHFRERRLPEDKNSLLPRRHHAHVSRHYRPEFICIIGHLLAGPDGEGIGALLDTNAAGKTNDANG